MRKKPSKLPELSRTMTMMELERWFQRQLKREYRKANTLPARVRATDMKKSHPAIQPK